MFARSMVCFGAVVLVVTSAQLSFRDECPSINSKDNFDPVKYLGIWYEQSNFNAIHESGLKCQTFNYLLRAVDTSVSIELQGFDVSSGTPIQLQSTAYPDVNQPAAWSVNFFVDEPSAWYNVLATDYFTYSVVYSCSNVTGNGNVESGWILTREPKITEEQMELARAVFTSNDIDPSQLQTVAQDC